jgi:hypothetical protein
MRTVTNTNVEAVFRHIKSKVLPHDSETPKSDIARHDKILKRETVETVD